MQPQQYSRIDLADLKAQLVKRIGAERSKRYFYYLNKLLSQKLSKKEFDKFCYRELGSENVSLHNQLIRSILKNACQAKTPPPINVSGPPKLGVQAANSSPGREDGHEQSGIAFSNQNQNVPIWSNGVLPMSPRKGRSAIRDRKKDRPSPLGPNGKVDSILHPSMGSEDSGSKVGMENGDATPCDYQRPVQHLLPVAEMPEIEREAAVARPTEKPRIHCKDQARGAVTDDGEEAEQSNGLSFSKGPLLAPLGIPLCSASLGGSRKATPVGSSGEVTSYYDSGGLSDTDTLRKRMEQIAAAQGLGGVSMECANMLNNVLDAYLKRLIRSCVELVGARSTTHELKKQPAQKQQIQSKVINGMWPSNHLHMHSGNIPLEAMQDQRPQCSISMLDFKVAMELNLQQLGEDWPLLLEKICMHALEE
ncbi:Transcriptional coactivator [Parasponia andersonii]|uniref:Transcriptional coactivator n=1 Tax=Parasponia andersonii TaxID=3476 RepID=A0A2P5DIE3_PARAD|nr:Transcriptional coactivator [Parasponia andersonii]